MKRIFAIICTLIAVYFFAAAATAKEDVKGSTGEEIFKKNCAVCHPDGRNIINPRKTLLKKDRDANNVKRIDDVLERMRNPGPGMTRFDKSTISDQDARKIAEYIFKTFK